jgi:hypothetical protein
MAKVYSIEKVKNLFTKVSLTDQYKLEIDVNSNIIQYVDNKSPSNVITDGPRDISQRGDAASFSGLNEKVSVMCRAAQIPGTSLEYETLIGARQGLSEIFPTYRKNLAIDCTFYVDKDHDVVRFFQRWFNLINPVIQSDGPTTISVPGVENRTGISNGIGVGNQANFYRMNYKDDYQTTITLTKFEKDSFGESNRWRPNNTKGTYNVEGLKYTFYRAFPVDISSVPVSYDTADILQISVTFEYERYSVA